MAKKTLLEGRKRISELADSPAVDAKKQELLHLKAQELPASEKPAPIIKPEQARLPLEEMEPVYQHETSPSVNTVQPAAKIIVPTTSSAMSHQANLTAIHPEPVIKPIYQQPAPAVAKPQAVESVKSAVSSTSFVAKPMPASIRAAQPSVLNQSARPVQETYFDAVASAKQLQALYQRLEKAGTPHRYQYTMQARHDLIVQEIKKMIQQKSLEQHSQGMKEADNLAKCQAFAELVRKELSHLGIRINPLQVKKPKPKTKRY